MSAEQFKSGSLRVEDKAPGDDLGGHPPPGLHPFSAALRALGARERGHHLYRAPKEESGPPFYRSCSTHTQASDNPSAGRHHSAPLFMAEGFPNNGEGKPPRLLS
jgi:hypothetical protein